MECQLNQNSLNFVALTAPRRNSWWCGANNFTWLTWLPFYKITYIRVRVSLKLKTDWTAKQSNYKLLWIRCWTLWRLNKLKCEVKTTQKQIKNRNEGVFLLRTKKMCSIFFQISLKSFRCFKLDFKKLHFTIIHKWLLLATNAAPRPFWFIVYANMYNNETHSNVHTAAEYTIILLSI